ncbi:PAAR domain-containing protein [Burkholderia sp. BCC0405]|uniref:PAAR domain-containing protein n=1 Tax=Burkholderia sp. BCC0405 TaxID=2676298 RepID=UPI0015897680|nr:PAAR domain-containing protein [Burkholderia sp. BCC0405]
MFERLVVQGSRTTTAGCVIDGSAYLFDELGRWFAVDHDRASCGVCEGVFPISGSVDSWLDNGTAMVKDMDLVPCPCGSNYVLADPSTTVFHSSESDALGAAHAITHEAAGHVSLAEHDEQFTLLDGARRPLANVRYRIVTDTGQIFTGITDTAGQTARIVTDAAASLKIYTKGH